MTLKQFLKELDTFSEHFSKEALEFYNKMKEENSKNSFTENGKKILLCMKDNEQKYKNYSAKQLGELLFMSPRSISGAMKKLLNEGYINKKVTNPVTYELTDQGREVRFDK